MPNPPSSQPRKVPIVPSSERIDPTDARLLLALAAQPRATTVALAEASELSRNTVQVRLAALDRNGSVQSFERRIDPAALGYPLSAFVTTRVAQRRLDEVARALAAIPEVLQVHGLSGDTDLLVHVAATDAEDLYRVAGRILDIPGVERTSTALVMRQLVPFRLAPLLRRTAAR